MRLLAILSLMIASTVSPVEAIDITQCGQAVPAAESAVLVADLACAEGEIGVTLGKNASLSLNGHSLQSAGGVGPAISCPDRHCSVAGPGEIGSGEWDGIVGGPRGRIVARDLSIHDVTSGIGVGTLQTMRLEVSNVTIRHSLVGITGGGLLLASNLTVQDNLGYWALARRFVGTNVTATGNGLYGVGGGRVRMVGLVATGNHEDGVNATLARLRASTVTDNGTTNGVDVRSILRPFLRDTTCGTSAKQDGTSWGVCQND